MSDTPTDALVIVGLKPGAACDQEKALHEAAQQHNHAQEPPLDAMDRAAKDEGVLAGCARLFRETPK